MLLRVGWVLCSCPAAQWVSRPEIVSRKKGGGVVVETVGRIPSWDETFLALAATISARSKDPQVQVGACIVSANNKVLAMGYNGTPRGMDDATFPWVDGELVSPEAKYAYVIHAERNAVLNYRGVLADFEGARAYVTHLPCVECTKTLVQLGVSEIIYRHHYTMFPDADVITARLCAAAGTQLSYCPD